MLRASRPSAVLPLGVLAALAVFDGCSSGDSGYHFKPWTPGTAGSPTDPSGSAGTGLGGGDDGGLTGAAGIPASEPVTIPSGAGGGDPGITAVVPSTGCGQEPGQELDMAIRGTVQTMGTKPADAADSAKGDWSYEREYFVTLPVGYDKTKAYPLVIQAPGCSATGLNVLPLNSRVGTAGLAGYNVDNTVIRVGVTPPPNAIGHSTSPYQGCFDDREGDDSVDWVFYENLYDKLSGLFCVDRNRVFAEGGDSGANFVNQLGCKYAGDAAHPLRGVLVNGGGLPSEPQYLPTCTTKPMAGMWMQQVGETNPPFAATVAAVNRAMAVNGCGPAKTYETAELDAFPIVNFGGSCRKMRGCPELYPIVVCPLSGVRNYGNADLRNVGFSTFLKLFETAPLLTP